ncbi:MAG: exodeoxyribonuclease VII large subunit [Myxococcota bacterium]
MTQTHLQNFGGKVWTVGEITAAIKQKLELSFPFVTIRGEISNSRIQGGHLYFTLKDSEAVISAIMFASALRGVKNFKPADGMEVLAYGRISVYPPHGKYQIIVERLEKLGAGALETEFFKLKERLEKEGLFDPARKKHIPPFPRIIGVITSREGAAIHDILKTVSRKNPAQRLLIRPSLVQGENAPKDLIAAIKQLSQIAEIDVIILARGGGSLEDLWAFNDEQLAREIFNCSIPVISGVGHESDFTICDFVSDLRAATPTAAAEAATPDLAKLLKNISDTKKSLRRLALQHLSDARLTCQKSALSPHSLKRILDRFRLSLSDKAAQLYSGFIDYERELWTRLKQLRDKVLALHPQKKLSLKERELTRLTIALKDKFFEIHLRAKKNRFAKATERLLLKNPAPKLEILRGELDANSKSIRMFIIALSKERRKTLEFLSERLHSASPESVLNRGYSITRDAETKAVIKTVNSAPAGAKLNIILKDGELSAQSLGKKSRDGG